MYFEQRSTDFGTQDYSLAARHSLLCIGVDSTGVFRR